MILFHLIRAAIVLLLSTAMFYALCYVSDQAKCLRKLVDDYADAHMFTCLILAAIPALMVSDVLFRMFVK